MLIDFGVGSRYTKLNSVTKQMEHIPFAKQNYFDGNIAFCSPFAKNKYTVSRRDDLYSLIYFLTFLSELKIPFSDPNQKLMSQADDIQFRKENARPKDFLTTQNTKPMIPVAKYIFSLKFEEKPDYNRIRFYFTKNLLDREMVPNNLYDWNQNAFRGRKHEMQEL